MRLAHPVVSLLLLRFPRWRDRVWALGQMGLARGPIARLPGIGFFKLMGAGTGEGFTPVPDTAVMAILATWPDREQAEAALATAPVLRRLRDRAGESYCLHLRTLSVRGRWSGREPFAPDAPPDASGPPAPSGPVAALTRARLRPRALPAFWSRVPAISRRIGADPNVILKIGIGEIPWFNQVTFSVWPDAGSMDVFARSGGAHAEAIRAARMRGWFAEELYARFAVLAHHGRWGGRDPLAPVAPALAAE
jgi:spheroidene monooxygenase